MIKGKDFMVKAMVFLLSVVPLFALLTGCDATHTAINKRSMDVQTKMSSTVFLDPVTEDKKTVFLQIRNTSDKPEFDLENQIAEAMQGKGYKITKVPEEAHYLLQANVLQVGRTNLRTADNALHQGFGAAIGGAIVGAGVGTLISPDEKGRGAIAGGLMGSAVATVGDAMVQDVVYCVIADLQISERVGNSVVVREKTRTKLKQGIGGVREVTSTEKIDWKRYQTRIVGTANKVNLKFKKAAPDLVQGLTRGITGVF